MRTKICFSDKDSNVFTPTALHAVLLSELVGSHSCYAPLIGPNPGRQRINMPP